MYIFMLTYCYGCIALRVTSRHALEHPIHLPHSITTPMKIGTLIYKLEIAVKRPTTDQNKRRHAKADE